MECGCVYGCGYVGFCDFQAVFLWDVWRVRSLVYEFRVRHLKHSYVSILNGSLEMTMVVIWNRGLDKTILGFGIVGGIGSAHSWPTYCTISRMP